MNSETYEMARTEMTEADRAYNAVRDAYRAMTVGDAEYFAARTIWKKAQATFDAAFAAEAYAQCKNLTRGPVTIT